MLLVRIYCRSGIFACLNFREFLIFGLFTKLRIPEFFFSSAIIIIILARFLNSRISPSREILPDLPYNIYKRCLFECDMGEYCEHLEYMMCFHEQRFHILT